MAKRKQFWHYDANSLIGGTYDLITPLMNEQFNIFSALNNSSNRFLIIEERVISLQLELIIVSKKILMSSK